VDSGPDPFVDATIARIELSEVERQLRVGRVRGGGASVIGQAEADALLQLIDATGVGGIRPLVPTAWVDEPQHIPVSVRFSKPSDS
jgi:hypothetical protein